MTCLACGAFGQSPCAPCRRTLVPAPETVCGGLVVRAAFVHEGAARSLVRRLKYDGVPEAARGLAGAMAEALPTDARVLAPVPRSLARRVRYGIDQSLVLANAVSERSGLPVTRVLAASPVHLPNAGRGREGRRPPRFRMRGPSRGGIVLVDDVVTTGTTLLAAAEALGGGVVGAVTATRAMPRSHGERLGRHPWRPPAPGGGR